MDNKTINEIAAQIAQNYETAEVPMYGQRLCLPDRASVIAILELLQKSMKMKFSSISFKMEKMLRSMARSWR